MLKSDIVLSSKKYVESLLYNLTTSNGYFYHNIEHTLDVFDRASYLAYKEWLDEEMQELIHLAALFHDVWYVKQYDNNEVIWAEFAEDFLLKYNFPKDKIDIVKNLILDTIVWQEPSSKAWFVIKDADLDNIWRSDFFEKNIALYKELKINSNLNMNKKTRLKNSLKLLENHKFYTKTQQEERIDQLRKNKEKLIKILKTKY